ncbi:uncharacterized protein BX663DRAFT_518973 [Cokeromyces recurvatus]|uniref:uncharacterized protein n=1 Tax=Cokeromyces recurvatus TaxID=90255 RepID=UPI00221FC626|nr:uncharacterized protein BX663DRAFT_522199 [Cokeromyces recurvatus]XP_051380202.1 uncharacterized protein BX663DRAFT_518973 [Cokeromyces recurvatus]KAI7899069.1 hypothetical protein BX663DRAFT_522199 [Cokeromyces recurvatus]KAI7900217.1 hypothetical protein BX663DRAFT_518973 [Cokeromyces recurvatus]
MPRNNIPNLLDGKILTGVLPPDKQPPPQNFLSKYSQPILVDIESCIDDPSLAPLGIHVKKGKKIKKNTSITSKEGQVQITDSRKHEQRRLSLSRTSSNTVMLRRRGLETSQLAEELNNLLLPSLNSFLKLPYHNQYTTILELDISRNRLDSLPSQISELIHLRILNATSNQITEIPSELFALKELEVLSLSQNQITFIPEDMPRLLPNLVTFRIAANLIESLPKRLNYWQKLRHLQLGSVYGGNKLIQLPDSLTEMPVLEELDVSYNQLRRLPPDLHLLQSLQILNASHNQLECIPKSITRCYQLRSLNLSQNHLTTLPADLMHLQRLELLDISENLLCIMPAEILERMQSTTLLITGNPLTRPGHCDQQSVDSGDAYSRILRQMMQRGVPRSSSSGASSPILHSPSVARSSTFINKKASKQEECGPYGMGCLLPESSSASSSSSSSAAAAEIAASTSHSPYDDEDATIDKELAFHAQQLNINKSQSILSSSSYPTLAGLTATHSRSKFVQDHSTHNNSCVLVDFPHDSPYLPSETALLLSLREIATRTILQQNLIKKIPFELLPYHLSQDIMGGGHKKICSYCSGPFVNEWVTSVQIKSYGGHPAVVRRVRFCSTRCWTQCLPKEQSKSVICVHH